MEVLSRKHQYKDCVSAWLIVLNNIMMEKTCLNNSIKCTKWAQKFNLTVT